MRNVINHFGQRRINPIPMCPEKLCWVTPLRISEINPTPIDPTPIDPTSIDPTLIDPTPIDPTLMIDPILINSTPIDPTSIDSTTIDRSDPDDQSDPDRSDLDWSDPDRSDPDRSDLDRSDPVMYSHLRNINNLFEIILLKYYVIEFFIIFKIMGHFYDINIQTKDLRTESVIQTFCSKYSVNRLHLCNCNTIMYGCVVVIEIYDTKLWRNGNAGMPVWERFWRYGNAGMPVWERLELLWKWSEPSRISTTLFCKK